MAVWDIDLTTRAGAHGATSTAATAAYLYAGATAVGAVLSGVLFQQVGGYRSSLNLLPFIVVVFAIFAGFRLKDGKGLVLGSVLAAVVLLDLLAHLASLSGIPGIVLCALVFVFLIQGLRGVLALKRGTGFDDDDSDTFG